MSLFLKKSFSIDPLKVFLWTFRRNERDVVNLYNALSDVMRLATGGNMLNFGYWNKITKDPFEAQIELCNIFSGLSELDTAKTILDVGSGFSAPAAHWKSKFDFLKITCLNINFNQLKKSLEVIKNSHPNSNTNLNNGINLLNATSTVLPFPTQSFDRILVLESAQHIKPLSDFISESKRILKKKGILTLAIPVVSEKIPSFSKLGLLSMTWSSEHYTTEHLKVTLSNHDFTIIEIQHIGSMVYVPLANYYIQNRVSIKNRILTRYPSYVEMILFKSLQKMKRVSELNIIDYVLIKCIVK